MGGLALAGDFGGRFLLRVIEAENFRLVMKRLSQILWLLVIVQALAIVVVLAMRIHHRNLPFLPVMTTHSQIRGGIKTVLENFKADCGRYPTTEEGWKALVDIPTNGSLPGWRGPYFDPPAAPKDPYGSEYVYRCPGVFNTNSYDLYSCGPDGVSRSGGNDLDDFNNWDPSAPHGGMSKDLFYGFGQIFKNASVLLIVPFLFFVWRMAGIFSPRVRAVIKENPAANAFWLAMSIVVIVNFITSFPPLSWR
jgi:general secretion pathway protein G